MMLSWLSTSEAHKHTSMYMIWQYESMHKVKRESQRDNGSNENTSNLFRGSSHCSTSPPSHRRISTISAHTGLPHREPLLRIWGNTTGSTQLLSQPKQPLTEARHKATQINLTNEGQAQSQYNQSTSHQRDRTQSHRSKINLYTRGISQIRRVTTWWFISPTNNFFHKIKILQIGQQDMAQV